jgi:hypothetical protein
MVAKPGSPFRSANAGELSPGVAGRVDIKPFYSAGLRFKNVEPVPLAGFQVMAGSFDNGEVRGRVAALAKAGEVFDVAAHTGAVSVWSATIAGKVAAIDCTALLASSSLHSIQAQVFVLGSWKNFGTAITVGNAARAITIAVAPTKAVSATAVRLLCAFASSAAISTGTVTVLTEGQVQDAPRYASVKHDSGAIYALSLQAMFMDIFENDAFVAGVYLPAIDLTVLPHASFYTEDATIGIAQNTLKTMRVRRSGNSFEWQRDNWPYSGIPAVDLGGVYAKTDDQWEVQVKYTGTPFVYISFTVEGETTPGVAYVDAANLPVAISSANLLNSATKMKAALEALPSLVGGTVTVVITVLAGSSHKIVVTFGGTLSGAEYQVTTIVSNTADAAALASHTQIGKTDFEALFSVARGWPGVFGFMQDRMAYGDILEVPPAISLSQAAEYFNVNIKAAGSSAARLDKLRGGNVSERVLAFAEATYPLVFTDRSVYFAANRTITKTEALNFVKTASSGIVPNCEPVSLESKIYYVGVNPNSSPPTGHQLLSLSYSELSTSFEPVPEHIMAAHLVDGIVREKGQKSISNSDASKLWLLRSDGRLVVASIIHSQEILGFCEWISAAGGLVREIHVDENDAIVRMAVLRNGRMRHERQSRDTWFQAAISKLPDLSGVMWGLEFLEGQEVWAKAEGYVLGPFTVMGGRIDLGDAYSGEVQVGVWQPPVFESMPRLLILRNDEVVRRPGRIHTVRAALLGTTSIAIGANGQAPRNVSLTSTTDPANAPMPPKNTTITAAGLLGHMIGTTFVVTQTKPGALYVRDLEIEEKL